jgi:hypothetical protein
MPLRATAHFQSGGLRSPPAPSKAPGPARNPQLDIIKNLTVELSGTLRGPSVRHVRLWAAVVVPLHRPLVVWRRFQVVLKQIPNCNSPGNLSALPRTLVQTLLFDAVSNAPPSGSQQKNNCKESKSTHLTASQEAHPMHTEKRSTRSQLSRRPAAELDCDAGAQGTAYK